MALRMKTSAYRALIATAPIWLAQPCTARADPQLGLTDAIVYGLLRMDAAITIGGQPVTGLLAISTAPTSSEGNPPLQKPAPRQDESLAYAQFQINRMVLDEVAGVAVSRNLVKTIQSIDDETSKATRDRLSLR